MTSQNMIRHAYVCTVCGSDQVTREAWTAWDVDAQAWVLNTLFDYAYCHLCLGYAQLEQVVLTNAARDHPAGLPSFPPPVA